MKPYKLLILSLFSTALLACSDEKLYQDSQENLPESNYIGEGEPLDVLVENMELRTRDVEFEYGTAVRVNTVWLGVFDYKNGYLVSQEAIDAGYAFLESGVEAYGMIRHHLPAPSLPPSADSDPDAELSGDYFMIAVVNYQGVKARWNDDRIEEEYLLSEMLAQVQTWKQFNSIGIDTYGAYEGDHAIDAPMMVGFLNGKSANASDLAASHIKIDQYQETEDDPVALSMEEKNELSLSYSSTNKKYTTENKRLILRRLVSNINFNIDIAPDLEITKLSYRRYNLPTNIYIVERTMLATGTNDGSFEEGKFPIDKMFSPNFADLNTSEYYQNDESDITPVNLSTPDLSGIRHISFSFQHFANKHWARNAPQNYIKRESILFGKDSEGNSKPYFTALCAMNGDDYDTDDFNNHATYVELKMRLLDHKRNRCAEVVYIIHEGMTSDHDGTEISWTSGNIPEKIYSDFSCARNRDYTYNITVNGFDNVSYNVNEGSEEFIKKNENITEHRADQQGKVWTIRYIGDDSYNEETGESNFGYNKSTDSFGKYLKGNEQTFTNAFSITNPNPVIAFRIYGYNSQKFDSQGNQGILEGFNFQFQERSFDYLDGMWPPSVTEGSHYFNDYNSLIEDFHKGMSEEDLEDKIVSVEGDDNAKTLKAELIEFLHNASSSIDDKLFNTFKIRANNGSGPNLDYENGDEVLFTDISETSNRTWKAKLKIKIDMNEWMNLEQFMRAINYLQKNQQSIPQNYDLLISERDWGIINTVKGKKTERELVRCLYIGDRAGDLDQTDQCSNTIKIFSAIQGIQK